MLARRIALSCVRKISSCFRQYRIALLPRYGFSSFSILRYGIILSPPISRVLIFTGLCLNVSAVRLYSVYCSSSVGSLSFSRNISSVLKSPIPSAVHSLAFKASSDEAILQKRSFLSPSAVTVGAFLYFLSSLRCFMYWSCFLEYSAKAALLGETITSPLFPSTITVLPFLYFEVHYLH